MLVSAVMPTRGRQDWARLAVQCFLSQDYPDKELVIVDDEDEPSFRDGVDCPTIRYFRHTRMELPTKRNFVNDLAHGDMICHWDSDDYSAPTRISVQVAMIKASNTAVVGFHSILFYEPPTQKVAKYIGDKNYACGTSLLYRKSWWATHPFRRPKLVEYGSDNIFVREARDAKELTACDADLLMVARLHPGNTSPNKIYNMNRQLDLSALPLGFPR